MQCQCCQHHEATVHLTQVINGEVNKLHLCEKCAQEQGLDLEGPISVTDLLCEFGKMPSEPPPDSEVKAAITCPSCGLGRADFKKTGRLGCPNCYRTFESELMDVVRSLHHAEHHVGKVPRNPNTDDMALEQIEVCRQLLSRAVEEERYEEAAELRDQLKHLLDESGDEEVL